jgi:hypothetical protein
MRPQVRGPCALKFEVGHQGEIARFEASQFLGHIHDTTLIVGRSSIARASRSFQGLAGGRGSEGGDLCCRKGLRSKNDLDVKEIVTLWARKLRGSEVNAGQVLE